MAELDSIEIEKSAVCFLKQTILCHKKMNDFISENDKEPSWDGMIYLYKENGYKAEDILCRVPVQIKGKNDPASMKRDSVTYPIEYKHLRNYDKDKGVVYIVVYVSDDCTKYQIFYNCLTPIKLQDLLKGNESKKPDQKKSVPMLRLKNNDVNQLFNILLQFDIERDKQGNSKGQILRHAIDKDKITNIDSVSWSTHLTNPDEIIKNISNGDICLYGHDTTTDLWFPFSIGIQKEIKIYKYFKLESSFGVDDQIFYNNVILKENNGEKLIQLSENLVIDDTKQKYHFKPITTLDTLINDIMFIKALRLGKKITINTVHKFDIGEIEFPEAFLNYLDWWERLIAAFKEFDIKCTKRMDECTDADWKNVDCLVSIYSNNISQKYKSNWWLMWWEKKVYPIYIEDSMEGKKRGHNLICSNGLRFSINVKDQHQIIPNFFMYKRDIWEKIYNFDESVVFKQLEKCDYSKHTEEVYFTIFIEILSAYDKTKNEKLYRLAKYISCKFEKIDPKSQYGIINRLQLLKRKRELTEEEIAELETIYKSPLDDFVSCAVEILLENKYSARVRINSMSTENQKMFKEFPIYNLL